MPEIIIVKNEAEAGEIYGRCVADLIKAKPDAVLGLATGSSPLAAYQALAKIVKDEAIDVSGVRGFALDEYIGLPLTHPESYHATIHRTVVEPLGLDPAKVHVPGDVLNGTPLEDGDKIALAGPAYDRAIEAAGGIDVQILGIGTDGHVGFNEPGSSLASGTRVKTLAEQTRIDNARFFDFVARCRAAGIRVPIIPGIKPLATVRHLQSLPATFGCRIPEELEREVLAHADDKAAVRRIGTEWAIAQSRELIAAGVPVLHYYPMGKAENIIEIARTVF